MDEDREAARAVVRRAVARMYWPLAHPYYDYLLREQGFSEAADAAAQLVPKGKIENALEAMPDELVDRLAIAGTPAECARSLQRYEGVLDEVLIVNPRLAGSPRQTSRDANSSAVSQYGTLIRGLLGR
jgi:alkanesulfonate monooxygenase SsuD/methylene tetrahydromethanopterin reductase-like flavin-dependent oxidoreductase (luciferase family)